MLCMGLRRTGRDHNSRVYVAQGRSRLHEQVFRRAGGGGKGDVGEGVTEGYKGVGYEAWWRDCGAGADPAEHCGIWR